MTDDLELAAKLIEVERAQIGHELHDDKWPATWLNHDITIPRHIEIAYLASRSQAITITRCIAIYVFSQSACMHMLSYTGIC